MNRYEVIRIVRSLIRECRSHTKCKYCEYGNELGRCYFDEWLKVREEKTK